MSTLLIILLLVVLLSLLLMCYRSREGYEPFEPLGTIDLPNAPKKTKSRLVLHYGPVALDLETIAKSVRHFAEQNQCDYYNAPDTNVWKCIHACFETFDYEYILAIPTRAKVMQTESNAIETLLRQAGDACMILCRDELDPKQVNTDVVLFRKTEWTTYKLHQLYYRLENRPDAPLPLEIVLDQVYTPFVHKTFTDFANTLSLGVPYMLSQICVYHEHALISSQSNLLRYHDRSAPAVKVPKVTMYPWSSIRHPRYATIRSDDISSIATHTDKTIPKIIFQTMETHLTTVHIRSCIDQVRSLNPKYKYYYFTAHDCRVFIQKHYPKVLEAYDLLLPGAYKADLWRYCVLHKYGGFYMDTRMYPFLSFDSIVTKETEFMSCIDGAPNELYQAILAAVPGSVYLQHAIDECVENIQKRRNRIGDLAITGPRVMGRALNKGLGRPLNKNLEDIVDTKLALLRWDSKKVPKYLMSQDEIFACHKYTKLLSDKEVQEETAFWLTLTGKEHYSVMYRNNRVYKDDLFR